MGRITGNEDVSPKITGNITYGIGEGDYTPAYEGEYNVTPLAFQETTLKTKDKKLNQNIVIKEIPYYETTNQGGGSTVYIAGQIEFS